MTTFTHESIIEAALMVADRPLTLSALQNLFPEEGRISLEELRNILIKIKEKHQDSGIELQEVASGYRLQARRDLSPWLAKLWEERSPRYSRAFLETLAIIAYKQPITRAEIESIRGVSVSSNIIKTLFEREWIHIIGHRDLPGKPAILGTTKTFLDYFNLKSLSELPTLSTLQSMETQEAQLQMQLNLEENSPSFIDQLDDLDLATNEKSTSSDHE